MPSLIAPQLSDLEANIIGLRFERAIVLDAAGNVVFQKDGTITNVSFDDDELKLIKGEFLHNHPLGWQFDSSDPRHLENGLSASDWLFAVNHSLDRMTALSPGFRYTITRNDAVWGRGYLLSELMPALEKADRKVRSTFKKKIKTALAEQGIEAYHQAIAYCDAHHNDQVSRLVSKALNISYTKEAIS